MARSTKASGPLVFVFIAIFAVVLFFIFDEGDPGTPLTDGSVEAVPAPAFSGDGYVLDFTDDFNPGLAGIDDLGISIVLAIDASGSMADPPASGGSEKYIQASAALSSIVDFLERFSAGEGKGLLLKVALIRFDDDVDTPFGLTVMDKAGFAKLRTLVSDPATFEPGGKTSLGLAIEWAAEILAQSGTIFKSTIVLSDGENTIGPEPHDVLFGINNNRVDASTVDVPISTRGTLVSFVGFDIDSSAFAELAELGARVSTANNQAQLESALTTLLVADITRLEAAD